jgi:Subtilase family
MGKIDPQLERLIAEHATDAARPTLGDPHHLTHVYIVVPGADFYALRTAGYDVFSPIGETAMVLLPIADIESLAARAEITAVFAPPRMTKLYGGHPLTRNQLNVKLDGAHDVTSLTRPTGAEGQDVVIGIVDSGVNVLHNAFTTETIVNGQKVRKTRIHAIWAQTSATNPAGTLPWEKMGVVYTRSQIDALIGQHPSGRGMPIELLDQQFGQHGTGVASIAAGGLWRDPLGPHVGVAPQATLVVVAIQTLDDIAAGIEFCFAMADELAWPCVVNISGGVHFAPHNGLSLWDHRVRQLLNDANGFPRSGRAVVMAAGNNGQHHNHARISVPDMPGSATLTIDATGFAQPVLRCFVSSHHPVLASIAPPRQPQFFIDGEVHKVNNTPRHAISIDAPSGAPAGEGLPFDSDFYVDIKVSGVRLDQGAPARDSVQSGDWRLKLESPGGEQPVVDVWMASGIDGPRDAFKLQPPQNAATALEDAGANAPKPPRPKDWIHHTLTSQACGIDAIIVGGVTDTLTLFLRTSRGPSVDVARHVSNTKPDILAPAEFVAVARWEPPAGNATVGTMIDRIMDGTSAAAPFATGAVALMLSHDQSLTQNDLRQRLRDTASAFDPAVLLTISTLQIDLQNLAGRGILNIRGAVQATAAAITP